MREGVALIVALVGCVTACTSADRGEPAVVDTLQAYEQAWSRHDGQAVASFYHEPAMRVSPAGPVVRPTQADQEAFFKAFLGGLVTRGYARGSWEDLHTRLLDPKTAIASGITVRYRADGSVLERVAVTYGLWQTGSGWKLFFSTTHSPDTLLRFR
jgi:ketosteroid isomerase-like protein